MWVWGSGVHRKPKGRSATRAYLGLVVEMASMNARASLLALTPPTGMRALPDPPQNTQRRDLSLTSTCRRSWSAPPARDVGCPCTSIHRLCLPRHAGGCHERHEGTTSAGNHGGGLSCASRAAKSHQERLQRPQGAHLPRRCLAPPRPIRFIVIAAVVVVVVLSMPCPPTHTAHSATRT